MNDDAFSKITFGLALLIFLPAIVAGGGFIIAIVGTVVLLVALFGGKFGLEIIKNREFGAKAGGGVSEVVRQPDDEDWERQ